MAPPFYDLLTATNCNQLTVNQPVNYFLFRRGSFSWGYEDDIFYMGTICP